jgi:phosphoserine phosphatase
VTARTPLPARVSTVIFDCDSTLSAIEGIEYLAGGNAEVEALTRAAMDGRVPLESVYGRRLEIVRPDLAALERLGRAYVEAMVPDAAAVVAALRAEGLVVRIISGGLEPAVVTLAHALGLDQRDVAAVSVQFAGDGSWAGFDAASPLTRAGGKLEVVRAWRESLPAPMMLVGDGATDAEARPAIDVFVAYCGVAERKSVVERADRVIRSASLAPVVPLALGGRMPSDTKHHPVWERGLALLEPGDRPEPETEPEQRHQRA